MEKQELERVETYLKKLFQRENMELRQLPRRKGTAEVFLGDELIATVDRDEEDGDLSYQFQMTIDQPDIAKTESYLRELMQRNNVGIRALPKKEDTAEVYLGEEFIATLYNDKEGGKVYHQLQMCILDYDLDEV